MHSTNHSLCSLIHQIEEELFRFFDSKQFDCLNLELNGDSQMEIHKSIMALQLNSKIVANNSSLSQEYMQNLFVIIETANVLLIKLLKEDEN